MATPTSSSYFLQVPKVVVQFFSALANNFAFVDKSHDLIIVEAVVSSLLLQQVQAADPFLATHSFILVEKILTALLHILTSVVFG